MSAEKIMSKLDKLEQSLRERDNKIALLEQTVGQIEARGTRRPEQPARRSLGAQVVDSPAFKEMREHGHRNSRPIKVDFDPVAQRGLSLTSSGVGALVDDPLQPIVSQIAQREPAILDGMMVREASTDTIRYVKETNFYDLYTELVGAEAAADTVILVKSVAGFKSGEVITLTQGATTETKTISSINYDTNEITLTAGLSNSYTAGASVTADEFLFTPEGEYKPRAKFDLTEQTEAVKTLALGIAASNQVLEDAPRLEAMINDKLPRALRRALETQILNGAGGTRQLSGILNASGIGTYSWSAGETGDTKIDAVRRAATVAFLAHYRPDFVVVNPNDWEDMELAKANGEYLLFQGPPVGNAEPQLFRMRIIESTAIASGTALVGSWEACPFYRRKEVEVRIFEQHEDFAERNMVYIRAEMRGALTVERPESFVKVTFDSAPA